MVGNRRRARGICGLAGLLGACGCAGVGAGGGLDPAQVRFVEISPGAPPMDFSINGTGAAYGVGYESFTSYLPVSPGAASLTVSRAGAGQALVTAGAAFSSGHQYTAVVSHGLDGLQERVFEDQETPAPAGQMALRVLNATVGVSAITVYVTPNGSGTAAPEAVLTMAAGAASSYMNRAAAVSYTVTATVPDGNLSLPVASVNVKAPSGAVRTVVFGGTASPGGRAGAVGFLLVDADAP